METPLYTALAKLIGPQHALTVVTALNDNELPAEIHEFKAGSTEYRDWANAHGHACPCCDGAYTGMEH